MLLWLHTFDFSISMKPEIVSETMRRLQKPYSMRNNHQLISMRIHFRWLWFFFLSLYEITVCKIQFYAFANCEEYYALAIALHFPFFFISFHINLNGFELHSFTASVFFFKLNFLFCFNSCCERWMMRARCIFRLFINISFFRFQHSNNNQQLWILFRNMFCLSVNSQ